MKNLITLIAGILVLLASSTLFAAAAVSVDLADMPDRVLEGESIRMDATVTNIGDVDLDYYTIQFEMRSSPSSGTGFAQWHSNLLVGETKQAADELSMDSSTLQYAGPAIYTFRVCVYSNVMEYQDFCTEYQSVEVALPKMDLNATLASLPSQIEEGETLILDANVTNTGDIDLAAHTVQFEVNYSPSSGTGLASWHNSLLVGDSERVLRDITMDSTESYYQGPGSYTIKVCVYSSEIPYPGFCSADQILEVVEAAASQEPAQETDTDVKVKTNNGKALGKLKK